MANISNYAEKAMLDWVLSATAVTRPTVWGVGLSLAAPTTAAASEIATGSGITRQNITFGAANASGTAYNNLAATFGTANAAMSLSGIQIWDTNISAGSFLWFGTLAAPRTLASGDQLVIATSALTIVLA